MLQGAGRTDRDVVDLLIKVQRSYNVSGLLDAKAVLCLVIRFK